MTDAAVALSGDTGAVSGNPAPAAASVDPVTDSGAAAISAAAAAAAPTAAPANDAWFGKLENPEVRTWAEAKGWKDPMSAVESAYNLEKLIGFDKAGRTLVVPDENSTPEQKQAFLQKLGVPEKPDGYNLPVPQGMDPAFSKEAANWMHEAGIPAEAGAKLAEKWNAHMASMQEQADQQFAVQSENEFSAWKAEQGSAADQNIELAKRAAAQFMPAKDATERQDMISKIERAIGTGNFMKMMAAVGAGLGEHKVHQGGEGGLVLTPAQAQQRIVELKSNREWTSAYLGGDKAKASEMENLMKLAYPEASNG